jgi:hypothetical protein
MKIEGSAHVMGFSYDEYTLAGVPISNAIASIATLSVGVVF